MVEFLSIVLAAFDSITKHRSRLGEGIPVNIVVDDPHNMPACRCTAWCRCLTRTLPALLSLSYGRIFRVLVGCRHVFQPAFTRDPRVESLAKVRRRPVGLVVGVPLARG